MEVISNWLNKVWFQLINLLEIQAKLFGQRLLHDSNFRDGVFSAVLFLIVVGLITQRIMGFIIKIRAFFAPVPEPVMRGGASGYQRYQGCLFSAFGLALMGICVVFILLTMLLNEV